MSPPLHPADRIRRLTASVVVVLYALLAMLGTSLVVCQEADGHVSIEWRGSSCCIDDDAPPASSGHSVSASAEGTAEDCFDCRDDAASSLLTSRGASAMRARSVPSPDELSATPDAVACSPASWTPWEQALVAAPRHAPIPPPPPAIARSAVLRV